MWLAFYRGEAQLEPHRQGLPLGNLPDAESAFAQAASLSLSHTGPQGDAGHYADPAWFRRWALVSLVRRAEVLCRLHDRTAAIDPLRQACQLSGDPDRLKRYVRLRLYGALSKEELETLWSSACQP